VFSAAVFGVLVLLVVSEHGANLDAPADPSSSDYPARPEWYFLSLFQMLKFFPGEREIVGTIIIPSAILVVMMLLPLFDKVLPGKLAHFLACVIVFGLVGGAGYLTYDAFKSDANDKAFIASRAKADEARVRALQLASHPEVGIPPDGATYVLLRDPLYHGKAMLKSKCLGCHVYDGEGVGKQVASDLKDFGTRAWVRGLLENPQSPKYFGKVPQCDGMAEWKKSSKLSKQQLDDVADFVGLFAQVTPDLTPDEWLSRDEVAKHPGLEPFQKECGTCHVIDGLSEGGTRDAPKLFGYGSPQWITRMIQKPGAPDTYGYLENKDQMPSMADQLTDNDVKTIVRYLRNDYVLPEPSGGKLAEPSKAEVAATAKP
jgi:ubiquinol-cytochrome c reductase cytochrome b subunit